MLSERELDDRIITIRIHTADSDNAAIIALVRANTPMPKWAAARIEELEGKLQQFNIALALGDSEIERKRLEQQLSEAYGYASRLFKSYAPQCKPMDKLIDVLSQLDNAMTEIPELHKELASLKAKNNRLLSRNDEREQELEDLKAELSKSTQEAPEGWEIEEGRSSCWICGKLTPYGKLYPFVYDTPERADELWASKGSIAKVTFYRRIPAPKPISKKEALLSRIATWRRGREGEPLPDALVNELIESLEGEKKK